MKYLLQTRDRSGHILTLGGFDRLVTPEEIVEQFGPNDYVLKRISPRFAVEWKYRREKESNEDIKENQLVTTVEKIGRRTKQHTYAIIGLGAVSAIGFGLSHMRFSSSEARIARLENVASTINANGLQCPSCRGQLDYMLQPFCSRCGSALHWPDRGPLSPLNNTVGICGNCNWQLLTHQSFCPSCGVARSRIVSFVPVSD